MKIQRSKFDSWRWGLALAAVVAVVPVVHAQITTNWVAYNDHRPGMIPPLPGQWGTALNVTTFDMGVSAGGGNLINFLDGQPLPVVMTVTPNGAPDDFGTAFPPNPGTPAYDLFFGICDLEIDGIVGVRFSSDTFVTFTFDNLQPDKRYAFRGTASRGGSYLLRWAVATIIGVDGALDAHTSGVLTSNDFPAALEPRQAALNSGENRVGDVVGWDFINPGADGSFSIICSNYVGPIPGNQFADNTRYGYSFGAILLAEVEASPPLITMQPAAQTTVEQGRPFTLSVAATGTPLEYQWYKGAGAIAGATFRTLNVPQAELADSGDYYVVVLNPLLNVTSIVAQVTVEADVTPPGLRTIFAYPAVNPLGVPILEQITVEFDEPVEPTSATTLVNYVVPGGVNPTSITLTNDRTVVMVLPSLLEDDGDYTVTISGVSDVRGNAIGSVPAPFETWIPGPGNGLLFEVFASGPGVDTAILTNSPVFPDNAILHANMSVFDTRLIYPDDGQEMYGARIRGVFIPPVSAEWVFFLRTYDRGELRFNPNGIDPAGAIVILAEVTGNDPRDWDKFISAPFSLQAGEAYYIEGLMQADVGTDVFKVAARLAGTSLPTLGVPNLDLDTNALSGAFIGSPLAPRDLGGPLTILQDLSDVIAEELHLVTLRLPLANPSGLPVHYQWFRDGSPIAGGTGPTYTLQATLADSGATFSVRAAKYGSVVMSGSATVTVMADTTPPAVLQILSSATSLTNIQVVYTELMNPANLDDPFNFTVGGFITVSATPDVNDPRIVNLELNAPLTVGQVYSITVSGGEDLSGNFLEPDPQILNFLAGGELPELTVSLQGVQAVISWPASATGFVLEETTALLNPPSAIVWTAVGLPPTVVNGRNTVSVVVDTGTRAYRLRQ